MPRILEQFAWELTALKIDNDLLNKIIDRLVKDGYVVNSATALKVSVDGEAFSGYQAQSEFEDKKRPKSAKAEYFFKMISILSIIISAFISSILMYLNHQQISYRDKIIERQKITIDSLKRTRL